MTSTHDDGQWENGESLQIVLTPIHVPVNREW
jgi:hypothetical protein